MRIKNRIFVIIAVLLCVLLSITGYAKKLSKKKKYTGVVNTKELNVRTWAGVEYDTVAFSPLHKGDKVSVCDTVKSGNGKKWYYICYKKHYGFVRAKYITKQKEESKPKPVTNADIFVSHLNTYSSYIKEHKKSFYYEYDGTLYSFNRAKNKVEKGKKAGITCVPPVRWGMFDMNITRKDGSNLVYGKKGSFKHCYTGKVKTYLKRIKVGKVYSKANLKKGDICTFDGRTHTSVYSGTGAIFFDSGEMMTEKYKYSNGLKVDYSKVKYFKTKKISEVLRWKE